MKLASRGSQTPSQHMNAHPQHHGTGSQKLHSHDTAQNVQSLNTACNAQTPKNAQSERSDQSTQSEPEEVSSLTGHKHPYVSEAHEGRPWFEWCVAISVCVCALIALFGNTTVATFILAAIAFITATIRLVMQHKSPWKIRSIAFDCIIGYGLAIGLPLTLMTVHFISR